MSTKTIKTIVQLRRNHEDYFDNIKDEYTPLKGEVVCVDTDEDGLRLKVGDGTSTYGSLSFADAKILEKINSVIVRGYYYNGKFYANESHTETFVPYEYKLYIDIPTAMIYSYTGKEYVTVSVPVPAATETTAGIMRLYQSTGTNTDGSISQSIVTENLNKKFEVTSSEDETIVFTSSTSK